MTTKELNAARDNYNLSVERYDQARRALDIALDRMHLTFERLERAQNA